MMPFLHINLFVNFMIRVRWIAYFFCYAATVLSPHRNILIFTQRMHKPT